MISRQTPKPASLRESAEAPREYRWIYVDLTLGSRYTKALLWRVQNLNYCLFRKELATNMGSRHLPYPKVSRYA